MKKTDDLRIIDIQNVPAPIDIQSEYPISENASETVYTARQDIHRILHGEDDRLLVVIGPCSIHDPEAAVEYAGRLLRLRKMFSDELHIVMRVYFEKPRTSIGWKGLINDPDLNQKFNIQKGLRKARKLLLDLANMGMPAATEYLDLISPQYISDLVSWAAIGARTTESQGHRELASGVSCPIGFKNGTYGNLDIAIAAVQAASRSHHFLSVTHEGQSAIFSTKGNEDCHIILRGGKDTVNYDSESVKAAADKLHNEDFKPCLMVDFSHANSEKNFKRQLYVAQDVAQQISVGEEAICGVMIESHLVEGNQEAKNRPLSELVYGQSITDACISWDDSETVLYQLAEAVKARRTIKKV